MGPVKKNFENLRLEYSTDRKFLRDAKRRVKPIVWRKCKRQLYRIRIACLAAKARRQNVHTLIVPKLKYSAACRETSGTEKLAVEVERCLRAGKTLEREVQGSHVDG